MKLKKSLANLIEWERICRVGTVSKTGMPHVVPVCHVVDRGKIYFASGNDALKIRHLRANPELALTVDLYSDAWSNLKGVMIQGRTAFIDCSRSTLRLWARRSWRWASMMWSLAMCRSQR